ncbi:MAG TPA: Trm112 family protein [Candidatus Nanoarchaeia archaeon]|nr:Trm112 family protein [Candidatus Nanoarchaeia archaeon]
MVTNTKISPELLKILVCPECKQKLRLVQKVLRCARCGDYPIIDGIPHLIRKI